MKKFRGDFLRELRKKKGLSQAQTGKVAGVAGPTVGTWERGVSAPSAPTVKMLAEYFGVEESDFWESPAPATQESNSFPPPKTEGDILRHVAALVSTGCIINFGTNGTTGNEVAVLFFPDIDTNSDLWKALAAVGGIQAAAAAGLGVNAVDGSTVPVDWQSILGPYLDRTLPKLDKIPLGKEETPAPEE